MKKLTELDRKLFDAIRNDNFPDVEKLVDMGADVNVATDTGLTPLMAAVIAPKNKCEFTSLLLKNGADVFARDKKCKTAYDHVIEPPEPPEHHENSYEAWIYCAEHTVMNFINDHKRGIFFQAIRNGLLEKIKFVVENGVSVPYSIVLGKTPLMTAMYAKKFKFEIVKFLVENGADLYAEDYNRKTVLDHLDISEKQIEKNLTELENMNNSDDISVRDYLLDKISTK